MNGKVIKPNVVICSSNKEGIEEHMNSGILDWKNTGIIEYRHKQ